MFGPEAEHWLGPRLDPASPDYSASMERIRQNYVVQNLLASVMSTHVSAVLGREIDWELKPESTEAPGALTTWYYRQRIQETLQDACRPLLWACREPDETSSILRFRIPGRALDDSGRVRVKGLGPVLNSAVRLMHPKPGTAGIIRDEDGEQIAGWYAYTTRTAEGTDEPRLELVALDTTFALEGWDREDDRLTLTDETVIQIRSGLDLGEIVSEVAYPLGGALTIFEMSRPPLITEDVISQQDGLNTQWTYLNRHSSASAFLERVILNGMPPGRWVAAAGHPDADNLPQRTVEGVKQVYAPAPYLTGPGTTSYVAGIPTGDGYTNPTIQFQELSTTEPLLANIRAHREAILELTNQMHRLINGDATASGVSRQQALGDFYASLGPTETQVKLAVAWLLKTALLLAAHLDRGNSAYLSTEVDAKVILWAAPPTPDEQRLTLELVKGGLLSSEEGMRRIGVQDTAKAATLIQKEADARHERALELMRGRTAETENNLAST